MSCCRHTVDDHGPAGCCWCSCRISRADHPARAEVELLEDWRRAGSALAAWTTSAEWTTPTPAADQPESAAGELPWH